MLKENEKYTINGEEYTFTVDVDTSGMFSNPVAVFSNSDKIIKVTYDRLRKKYTFSESIDFNIEYSSYGWRHAN
ncbi:hypothetical protein [Providencia phage PSTRCR_121]|nr:hypothetical protein [Providencia phage PSTRCR_121]